MNILNKYFDNIYVLYIDNDELGKISPKLRKRNIKVQYFNGINGYQDPRYSVYEKRFRKQFQENENMRFLNKGSYGHLLSFINILNDAIKRKYKKILILEPDIYFCKNFDQNVKKYLEMDYKMLYLGASQNKFYREETWEVIEKNYSKELRDNFYYAYNTLGTFALGLDSSIFERCKNVLLNFTAPTDVSFITVQDSHRTDCIVAYPNIICCDLTHSKTSAIKNQQQSMHQLRWDILKYDFEDMYCFKTEKNAWYQLSMKVDSYVDKFLIHIQNEKNMNIFPPISNNINKYYYNNGDIVFFIFSPDNNIFVKLTNIFLCSIKISKNEKRDIKRKLPLHAIGKIKSLEISKYYLKNLFI